MAASNPSPAEDGNRNIYGWRSTCKKYDDIISNQHEQKDWKILYQDFWVPKVFLKAVLLIQDHFIPKPDDIILVSHPKSGTQWFRSLIFTILNRNLYNDFAKHPLLDNAPPDLCPSLERSYRNDTSFELENISSPRFLSSHVPFPLFHNSIKTCRIVYVCRNPKDVFVSGWFFFNKIWLKQGRTILSFEDAFESFCQGSSNYGPYWDHVLSCWKASLETPKKVLFMKYEDMKREPLVQLKRMAEFLDKPFSMEEQDKGVVEEIIKLCSFEKLSNLEVNRTGNSKDAYVDNPDYFRKGQVGDWKNHLTPEMAARLDQITEEKFHGSGLTFDVSP